jgi:hypothetical protein
MSELRGIVSGGRVDLAVPATWPDGTEVAVFAISPPNENAVSPEEIARTLAAMDQVEPFELSDAELAAWEAERRTRKEWEQAHFFARADAMRDAWQ